MQSHGMKWLGLTGMLQRLALAVAEQKNMTHTDVVLVLSVLHRCRVIPTTCLRVVAQLPLRRGSLIRLLRIRSRRAKVGVRVVAVQAMRHMVAQMHARDGAFLQIGSVQDLSIPRIPVKSPSKLPAFVPADAFLHTSVATLPKKTRVADLWHGTCVQAMSSYVALTP